MLHPKPEKPAKRDPRPGHPYLEWLTVQRCETCKKRGSEAAHVRGPQSANTNEQLPRRKAEAYLSALPLCPTCHQHGKASIHALGERGWGQHHYGHPDAAARIAHRYLSRWALTKAAA